MHPNMTIAAFDVHLGLAGNDDSDDGGEGSYGGDPSNDDERERMLRFAGAPLTSITIRNTSTAIGRSAFANTLLTEFTIPSSITYIGSDAFRGSQIASLVIPESVQRIGYCALASEALANLTLYANEHFFGADERSDRARASDWFGGGFLHPAHSEPRPQNEHCEGITMHPNLTITAFDVNFVRYGDEGSYDGETYISTRDDNVLSFADTPLVHVTIRNTSVGILSQALRYTLLTSIDIPSSVQVIGKQAFQGSLRAVNASIDIPSSVTTIGDEAFADTQITTAIIRYAYPGHNFFKSGMFPSSLTDLTAANIRSEGWWDGERCEYHEYYRRNCASYQYFDECTYRMEEDATTVYSSDLCGSCTVTCHAL